MKVVIDGNIGAGKTTQLGLLESKGWYVHKEPIHQWPLKEFYEDQIRWTFLLHMRILETLEAVQTEKHVIYERCMWSSRYVFWPLIQDKVHPIEHETYNFFFHNRKWYPDIYIYLSKTPEIAHAHIQKRNQTGDESVSLDYLRKLDEKYKELAKNLPQCRTYIIDANRTELEIHQEISAILVENELFVTDSFRKEV